MRDVPAAPGASAYRKWINWKVSVSAPKHVTVQMLGEGSDLECVAMLLSEEARNCRVQAERFAGKAEAPFLLHLAEALKNWQSKSSRGEPPSGVIGTAARPTAASYGVSRSRALMTSAISASSPSRCASPFGYERRGNGATMPTFP